MTINANIMDLIYTKNSKPAFQINFHFYNFGVKTGIENGQFDFIFHYPYLFMFHFKYGQFLFLFELK